MRMYRHDFNAYVAFVGAGEALNPQAFSRWRAYMAGETTLSPKTINRMLTSVRSVIREAANVGLVEQDTWQQFTLIRGVSERALKRRMRPHNRTVITPEQMRAICEAPDTATLIGLRDRALLLTMATSGCRVSEVLRMRDIDIRRDGDQYFFRVVGKVDIEPRVVPLSPEAKSAIDDWILARPVDTIHVFTSFRGRSLRVSRAPLSPRAAWAIVRRYAGDLNIPHIKPHDFRRFVATQLAQKNIRQAQKVMGHANINITMRYYVLDEVELGITNDLF